MSVASILMFLLALTKTESTYVQNAARSKSGMVMSDEASDRCAQHAIQAFIAIGEIKSDIGQLKAMMLDVKGHVITQEDRIGAIEGWKNQLVGAAKLTGKVVAALLAGGTLAVGVIKVVAGG